MAEKSQRELPILSEEEQTAVYSAMRSEGLSIRATGNKIGVSYGTLNRVLHGKGGITSRTAADIYGLLGRKQNLGFLIPYAEGLIPLDVLNSTQRERTEKNWNELYDAPSNKIRERFLSASPEQKGVILEALEKLAMDD